MNIPHIPMIMINASLGSLMIRPCISSISLECMQFSISPTVWNRSDFETAWKRMSIVAAQTPSVVPVPAQAVIRPRFEIVE